MARRAGIGQNPVTIRWSSPGKPVPGDDGLGEGEDRLELVGDPPLPCSACRGSGRQRNGFGSRTEPCHECGGTRRMQ